MLNVLTKGSEKPRGISSLFSLRHPSDLLKVAMDYSTVNETGNRDTDHKVHDDDKQDHEVRKNRPIIRYSCKNNNDCHMGAQKVLSFSKLTSVSSKSSSLCSPSRSLAPNEVEGPLADSICIGDLWSSQLSSSPCRVTLGRGSTVAGTKH
ncbi:hypothetical protein GH714_021338 [Hevea brasiliensis]|uniref:Uncharacterized protein n=1 Tax=Hevea brasiliensis TaxID=3981 RepID=A0A6A6M8J2_HEVBR|nr:hypothetical protein GH714_021338 [Hevea brasiliensis]